MSRETARKMLEIESCAIEYLIDRLGELFDRAVESMVPRTDRVIRYGHQQERHHGGVMRFPWLTRARPSDRASIRTRRGFATRSTLSSSMQMSPPARSVAT